MLVSQQNRTTMNKHHLKYKKKTIQLRRVERRENQPSKSSSAEPELFPAVVVVLVAAGFAPVAVVVETEADEAAPQMPSLNFCFAILSRLGPLELFASFF